MICYSCSYNSSNSVYNSILSLFIFSGFFDFFSAFFKAFILISNSYILVRITGCSTKGSFSSSSIMIYCIAWVSNSSILDKNASYIYSSSLSWSLIDVIICMLGYWNSGAYYRISLRASLSYGNCDYILFNMFDL